MRRRECILVHLKLFTYTSNTVVLKRLTTILITTILITIRCEKGIFRVSHASLHKRLTKTMECTPKLMTKVAVTEK